MGNIHCRNGVYYADYIDRSGRRQQPSLRTRDKAVARAKLRDLELATTDRAPQETETLDVALSYFVDVTCAGKSPGTIESYKQKARHLSRLRGDVLLDRLSKESVERYIAKRLEEEAAKHSIHKELVVLRGALNAAEERGRFHLGVASVVPEFDAAYEPRRLYLTPDQFIALVDNIQRPLGKNPPAFRRQRWERRRVNRIFHVMLMALASERAGEVELMQWENVDLRRNVIVVPDGKTGSRVLKIHPELRTWFEEYAETSGPICEPWGSIRRDLHRACDRAGIPRVSPNDLRRTFASWLVQKGVPLYVVSRLLGHKSTRMVELVYGQLDDATMDAAINALPGSHTGYTNTVPNRVTSGTTSHTPSSAPTVSTDENSANLAGLGVPSPGIEPGTRGFSVPLPDRGNAPRRRANLRLVG